MGVWWFCQCHDFVKSWLHFREREKTLSHTSCLRPVDVKFPWHFLPLVSYPTVILPKPQSATREEAQGEPVETSCEEVPRLVSSGRMGRLLTKLCIRRAGALPCDDCACLVRFVSVRWVCAVSVDTLDFAA